MTEAGPLLHVSLPAVQSAVSPLRPSLGILGGLWLVLELQSIRLSSWLSLRMWQQ